MGRGWFLIRERFLGLDMLQPLLLVGELLLIRANPIGGRQRGRRRPRGGLGTGRLWAAGHQNDEQDDQREADH
jgi:hypothetical protein